MRKGFIEYCPNCHYHTDFHEMSILAATRQVDEDWKEIRGEFRNCAVNCPVCDEVLEDYYGTGEPVVTGVYQNRKVSQHFMEVINETV